MIDVETEMSEEALRRYLESQGRFRRAGVDLARVQRRSILETWEDLRRQVA